MPDESVLTVPQELLILGAAVQSGIIKALHDGAKSCTDLVSKLGADYRATEVVLEALVALGYLDKQANRYTLTDEAGNMLYNSSAPNYSGFAFMHRYNLVRSWVHLPEVILSGNPHVADRGPERTAYFMAAMRHVSQRSAPAMAEFLMSGAGPGARVLDIGGGPLINAKAFTERGARVTVLDLPDVVELMNAESKSFGIEMIPGDFNEGLPPGPFEMAYLGNICHIFGEDENKKLFKKVHDVLVPGGRIAIVDFIRGTGPAAAVFGVNMLVNTRNGGTWTLAQYTGWLEAAGFSDTELNKAAERQVVTAIKS